MRRYSLGVGMVMLPLPYKAGAQWSLSHRCPERLLFVFSAGDGCELLPFGRWSPSQNAFASNADSANGCADKTRFTIAKRAESVWPRRSGAVERMGEMFRGHWRDRHSPAAILENSAAFASWSRPSEAGRRGDRPGPSAASDLLPGQIADRPALKMRKHPGR